jgi:hypothetical protein
VSQAVGRMKRMKRDADAPQHSTGQQTPVAQFGAFGGLFSKESDPRLSLIDCISVKNPVVLPC